MEPAIIVHGGAWSIPDFLVEPNIKAIRRAVERGYEILNSGGSALDAVEEAVVIMEDDPSLDAGYGSFPNEEGLVEMDAIIVDGRTLKFGSVASVKRVRNPIRLARLVMERTENHMFVSEGAEKLAESFGLDLVDPQSLISEFALRVVRDSGTVGAVAIDSRGNMAAATSTGGIIRKKSGRVGDSPLIGCGAFADNLIGAASATGKGEPIMRVMLSRLAVDFLARAPPEEAAKMALEVMLKRTGGRGGIILINSRGDVGFAHTTKRMAVAYAKDGEVKALVSELPPAEH